MFAAHAALRLQHLKRVHVRGHFRTLSEARDVSRSSPLLSFQSCSTTCWIHYSPRLCASTTQRCHQQKWKHSAISHSAQFGTSFSMLCSKISKTELFCGQLWGWFCRVKHAKRQGRRRFAESLGSFVGTRGGLTSWCRVEHAQWPGWRRFAESLGFLVDRCTSGWKISIGWNQAVMKCEQSKKVFKFGFTFLCWVLLIPTLSLSLSLFDSIFETDTSVCFFCVGNGHICIVLWWMFAAHAVLRLQHLKRVHVRGHFRTLSEARDVSRSSPLLSFQSCSTTCWIHYSPRLCASTTQRCHQKKWKHSAISHSAQFGTSFSMLCSKISKTKLLCSSGDDSAEWNMQSGKDDDDLQKALALSLEPLEDRTGAEFGSLLTARKVSAMEARNSLSLEGAADPRPLVYDSFPAFCLPWGHLNQPSKTLWQHSGASSRVYSRRFATATAHTAW